MVRVGGLLGALATVGVAATALVTLGAARDVDRFALLIPGTRILLGAFAGVFVRRRSVARRPAPAR